MSTAQTLPQYFLARVSQYGARKVALRQKEFGIWQEITWQDSYAQVRDLTLGLRALGVERGDRVATVGDNDRFYLWAYLGLLAIGGVQVGLYTDAGAEEMAYVIDHSDAVVVFAKDQEQCDKLLEIRDRLPKVRRVIYWEEQGLWEYDDPWLISFAAVQAQGRGWGDGAARLAAEVARGRGDDLAVLCYTSGTTGLPKGAMLTHANLVTCDRGLQRGGQAARQRQPCEPAAAGLDRRACVGRCAPRDVRHHHELPRSAGDGARQRARDRAGRHPLQLAAVGQPGGHGAGAHQ
jgi:long-chain acyl-CoA synthetase